MPDDTLHEDWSGAMPSPTFIQIPEIYFTRILKHLTGVEAKVMDYLMGIAYKWHTGQAQASLRDIQTGAGVSRGAVQNAVKDLHAAGLIIIEHQADVAGGAGRNLYCLNVADDERYTSGTGGVPTTVTGGSGNGTPYPSPATPTRARSLSKKNTKKNVPTNQKSYDDDAYTRGPYSGLVLRGDAAGDEDAG